MANERGVVLVAGATGKQGGAVARHLLSEGWWVRALTRDAHQDASRWLAKAGAELFVGDLSSRADMDRAVRACHGVFSVQQWEEHGCEAEVAQGKTLADAAEAAGVDHLVYSSAGGAERTTGIPHFESKREVERHLADLDLDVTVFRPVFFMDNLSRPDQRERILDGTLALPLEPEVPLQMIAVDDIGAFAARAFDRPDRYKGEALELAGDELTGSEAARVLERALGRSVEFEPVPVAAIRERSEELALMFEWFNEEGYAADVDRLRSLLSDLKTLADWTQTQEWIRSG